MPTLVKILTTPLSATLFFKRRILIWRSLKNLNIFNITIHFWIFEGSLSQSAPPPPLRMELRISLKALVFFEIPPKHNFFVFEYGINKNFGISYVQCEETKYQIKLKWRNLQLLKICFIVRKHSRYAILRSFYLNHKVIVNYEYNNSN